MSLTSTLLIAVFIVLLLIVALMLSPRSGGSSKGVTVNVRPDRTTVDLGRGSPAPGTKIEISTQGGRDAAPADDDSEFEPEMVEDMPRESVSVSFLNKLAHYDELPDEQKRDVAQMLANYGLVRIEDIQKFTVRDPEYQPSEEEEAQQVEQAPEAPAGDEPGDGFDISPDFEDGTHFGNPEFDA